MERRIRAALARLAPLVALIVLPMPLRAAPAGAQQRATPNYMGRPPSEAAAALGERARFRTADGSERAAPEPGGVIVWQEPIAGQPLPEDGHVVFLSASRIPMPRVVGMPYALAELFLDEGGLDLGIVSKCGEKTRGPVDAERTWIITTQCTEPGTPVEPGSCIGVILEPLTPPGGGLPCATLIFAALATAAAAVAIGLGLKLNAARRRIAELEKPH